MAFPNHYLCQFGGSLRGDIWCCNIRFTNSITGGPDADLSNEDQAEKAEDLATKIVAWMTDPQSGWGAFSLLEYVKFNRIGPSGAYADPGVTNSYVLPTPFTNGSTASVSNHDALVVSWGTGLGRGLASKGRIYIPAPSAPISGSTGRVSPTNCMNIANAAATFLNAANDDPNLAAWDLNAAVVSDGGAEGEGVARKITSVRVGDIMDSMQSRRNALSEAYSVATVEIL